MNNYNFVNNNHLFHYVGYVGVVQCKHSHFSEKLSRDRITRHPLTPEIQLENISWNILPNHVKENYNVDVMYVIMIVR